MKTILVTLPPNRNITGTLTLLEDGKTVAGPFSVSGRASDEAAAKHGNPQRTRTLRYGDTPTGHYKVEGHIPTGEGTPYQENAFGNLGAFVLRPMDGEAAIAEANGRSSFFIQAGTHGGKGKIGSTNGSLRVSDIALKSLIRLLGDAEGVDCKVIEGSTVGPDVSPVLIQDYDEGDPPIKRGISRTIAVHVADTEKLPVPSRRDVLRFAGLAFGAATIGASKFVLAATEKVSEFHYPPVPLDPGHGGMSIEPSALQVGDIVLSTKAQPSSKLIQFVTSGPVSHARIYVGNDQFVEAEYKEGVTLGKVEDDLATDTVAVAFRLPNLSSDDGAKIVSYALAQLGKQYDTLGAVSGALFDLSGHKVQVNLGTPGQKFYCSSLVIDAFRQANRPLTTDTTVWSPNDVAKLNWTDQLIYVGHLKD